MKKTVFAIAIAALLSACGGADKAAPAPALGANEPVSAAGPNGANSVNGDAAAAGSNKVNGAKGPKGHTATKADAAAKADAGMPPAPAKTVAVCADCGTVQDVHQEKRKGEGGAVGVVGGAVVGGLLGNQVGKGNGKTLATVGGAVAGGFAGNEVQKQVTSKDVWVTKVKMTDGSVRSFEQEAKPTWTAGSAVKVSDKGVVLP